MSGPKRDRANKELRHQLENARLSGDPVEALIYLRFPRRWRGVNKAEEAEQIFLDLLSRAQSATGETALSKNIFKNLGMLRAVASYGFVEELLRQPEVKEGTSAKLFQSVESNGDEVK